MSACAIAPEFAARVRLNEPLSRHTSWHAGGPADVFFTPRDRGDLAAFLRSLAPDTPLCWLGLGSNVLVRDGGVRGVVIGTHGTLDTLERGPGTEVYAEAGVACARLARQCIRWQLGPAAFFAGIPGTVGGALAMNAGAWGGETWTHVLAVETIDRRGREHVRARAEYQVGYRRVVPPTADEWFVAARFAFQARVQEEGELRELLERRRAAQPIGAWSCGSVFANPPGEHAARLIESAGLKGARVGDAAVSEKHANFIINHGRASGADLESLILHVQATVERVHGVRLEPEVRIIGARH